jgi:hypothetical protein
MTVFTPSLNTMVALSSPRAPIADAVPDRIVHQAIRIELYGESLRKKKI